MVKLLLISFINFNQVVRLIKEKMKLKNKSKIFNNKDHIKLERDPSKDINYPFKNYIILVLIILHNKLTKS